MRQPRTSLVVLAASAVVLGASCDACAPAAAPPIEDGCFVGGTPALTRLNRKEIDTTLAQMWGDTVQPARLFVADSVKSDTFDNDSASLAIAPQLVVDLEGAAGRVVDDVWARDTAFLRSGGGNTGGAGGNTGGNTGGTQSQTGSEGQSSVGAARDSAWNLWSDGEVRYVFNLAAAGPVTVSVDVFGEQAGDALPHADLWVNNTPRASLDVTSTNAAAPDTLSTTSTSEPAGTLTVGVRFTNDFYDPNAGQDRNLLIVGVHVTTTASDGGTPSPALQSEQPYVRVCTPASTAEEPDCARRIFARGARTAWRRAATDDELTGLVGLFNEDRADGSSFDDAVKLGLTAVLTSPHFLLRAEAVVPKGGAASPEAVAARLSYFLWGGPPDAALAATVDDGSLLADDVLAAQVDRMLADEKATALKKNLVAQWFQTRDITGFSLDPGLFPGLNQAVMEGAQRQVDAYLDEFFFSDVDVTDVLDAPVTYVDPALAGFLGVPSTSNELERVELATGDVRAGLFGQAATMMVTSNSTETNPPRRGKWVLERLLCQTIPLPVGLTIPPPPPATDAQPTARDRLENLTQSDACQRCHARLDPIGFGLENYGADGRFRTEDHGAAIDASGVFADHAFTTPQELISILKSDEQYERCFVEKTLSYAKARRLNSDDDPSLAALLPQFRDSGHRFRDLVAAVAKSPAVTGSCGDGANASGAGDDAVNAGNNEGGDDNNGDNNNNNGEGEGEGEGDVDDNGAGGAGVVFADDFEAGLSLNVVSPDCSGAGVAHVVDGGHRGAKALEVVGGGGYCDHVFVDVPLPAAITSSAHVHARFFVNINEALGQGHVTFLTLPDPVTQTDLRMGGQSGIVMWNREQDDATLPALSPTGIAASRPLVANSWTCVEVDVDGAAGTITTSLDGTVVSGLVLDGTATADLDEQWLRNGAWTTGLSSLRLGYESYGGDARTLRFDDLVVSDAPIGCN